MISFTSAGARARLKQNTFTLFGINIHTHSHNTRSFHRTTHNHTHSHTRTRRANVFDFWPVNCDGWLRNDTLCHDHRNVYTNSPHHHHRHHRRNERSRSQVVRASDLRNASHDRTEHRAKASHTAHTHTAHTKKTYGTPALSVIWLCRRRLRYDTIRSGPGCGPIASTVISALVRVCVCVHFFACAPSDDGVITSFSVQVLGGFSVFSGAPPPGLCQTIVRTHKNCAVRSLCLAYGAIVHGRIPVFVSRSLTHARSVCDGEICARRIVIDVAHRSRNQRPTRRDA